MTASTIAASAYATAPMAADPALLAALRAEIAAVPASGLGRGGASDPSARGERGGVVFGIDAVDRVLPRGGLARGSLHAVLSGDCRDAPAALGFTAGLASLLAGSRGMILWVGRGAGGGAGLADFGALYGPGLLGFGLDPDRMILAATRRQDDMLWALEQGLACPDLAAVVGEVDPAAPLSLTAARRLQLAATRSGVTALVVGGRAGREDGLVAAVTRWCVAAAPGGLDPQFEVGLNARGARPGHWRLAWDARARRFTPAIPPRSRVPAPGPARAGDLFDRAA